MFMRQFGLFVIVSLFCGISNTQADIYKVNNSNYLDILKTKLVAGDTLLLAPDRYKGGLNISNLIGRADAWITISGPTAGEPAVIEGRSGHNTVQLQASEYIQIQFLTVDGLGLPVDGINAKDGSSHHITLEYNTLINLGANQQIVGINTKDTAWDWIIRHNTILEAGTGIYLGNSTGSSPFIGGIIEGNFIMNTEGYNMEIKHQNNRPAIPGIPTQDRRTIIRNNVFIKDNRLSRDGDRPNLLVDGFPETGNGANDWYEVYGNFLYNNPRESLFQASGRVMIHDNIFVQASTGTPALYLGHHNRPLKLAYIFNNTFYGGSNGIRFGNAPQVDAIVTGNAIFAATPIGNSNFIRLLSDNITDSLANAVNYVNQPGFSLDSMDFYPRAGQLNGTALNLIPFNTAVDYNKDFNGADKGDAAVRGAYSGSGTNPGWPLRASMKIGGASNPAGPVAIPATPVGLGIRVN